MTPKDLEKYYKTGYKFYKETGITQASYSNWKKWGFIPIESQIKIQKLTRGILKASIDYIEPKPEPEQEK